MEITTTFHQLTTESQVLWDAANNSHIARLPYKENFMNWETVRKGSLTYRYRLDSTMISQGAMPEKIFLSFATSGSFMGDNKIHSGWLEGSLTQFNQFFLKLFCFPGNTLKSVTIDRGNSTPITTIDCASGLDNLWIFSMQENNVNPFNQSLPLMSLDKFKSQFFGIVCNLSRSC